MQHKNAILFVIRLFVIGLTGLQAQTLKDIDGNGYKAVSIGTQVWMRENLKTTKLNDGTAIPLVKDDNAWRALNTPAYCLYKNEATAKNIFGALYNWYTVNTKKICPRGWHVPSDEEWKILITYLGGEKVAGGKLKEKGTTHWESPNTGTTNESGFTALPGGYRNHDGSFEYNSGSNIVFFRSNGCWWSSTERYDFNACYLRMYSALSAVYSSLSVKQSGYSVRCLKD
jgi:uncharacterized protein (TIGR02145 family)